MKYFLIKNEKIIKQIDENYICQTDEIKISKKNLNMPVKVRRNGEYLNILKINKKLDDIFVGNVFLNSESKEIDKTKIKVYRGGTSYIINSNDFDSKNEQIEYIYNKHELKYLNENVVIKNDEELLLEAKEMYKKEIARKLLQKYPDKQIDGTLNILFQEKLNEIENATNLNELKIIEV